MIKDVFRKTGAVVAVIAGVWLGIRYLLPPAMPFLLGGLLALAAEPLVSFLHKRLRLPRGAAAGVGVTMSLTLLFLLLLVLGAIALRELRRLAGVVPELAGSAMDGMMSLENGLLSLTDRVPEGLRPMLKRGVEGMFSDGTALLDRVTGLLLGLASGIVTRLPDSLLGIGTWVLACYMISAKLPRIRDWIRCRLPESWQGKYLPMLQNMKKALGGWLGAQLRLAGVTCLLLSLGLSVLQIRYAVLWAVLIALLDALPVFGTGTALIPWSLLCFWEGDRVRGIGLLGVYACVSLVRSVLEPRLVGKQLGLDSLVTLAAMYLGYQLWGIGGMILAPVLAVMLTQLLSGTAGQRRQP